nr:LytR C-terminal domain-containing protein [Cellulomonas septica]
MAVLVLAPVLAYGAVTAWGIINGADDSPGSSTVDDGGTGDEGTTDGTEETPADGTEEPPVETEAPPAVEPVLSTPVQVLNASGVSGVAARQQAKLQEAGFTAATTGNSDGEGVTDSTVFYASEDLRSTADLVAQTLGLTAVTLDPDQAGDGIVVVLRTDPDA